ncbi:MAG: type II toxin-antitoxin system VapC family toxin [Lautropia sp.]|nr:type II toxin-antitoxin system VapC family toxin [Lautropia sp.]
MLDTNIIIYLMKNRPQAVADRVASLSGDDELAMSFITYGELLKGAYGSIRPEQSLAHIAHLIQRVPFLYPGEQTCHHYGKWAATLKRQGKSIGNNDLWIACHALSCGAILVTHNTKEFERIDGLMCQDWAAG